MIRDQIEQLRESMQAELRAAKSEVEFDSIEVKYLGRKGLLVQISALIPSLSEQERTGIGTPLKIGAGTIISDAKRDFPMLINQFRQARRTVNSERGATITGFDPTWPGVAPSIGHLHPISAFLERSVQFFSTLGYAVADGLEVETASYNFDKLNIPANHPARDLWDTYYLNPEREGILLRTHTSPVQVRYMESHKPPTYIVSPGRVYRREATDASHDTNFTQLEGLAIDRDLHITDLIGTLKAFLQHTFGAVKMRVRPSFFPFVEPGIEVDMSCLICHSKGCSVCKQTGWLEMLGAGMVHPKVLKNMKVDPKKYSGFAFGLGVERMVMLLHGISDIRLFLSGDQRFLEQFHY